VADTLSRLVLLLAPTIELQLFEYFNFDWEEFAADTFPITYANIAKEQRKDALLVNLLSSHAGHSIHTFHGRERHWQLVIL
jgi:hypothetical protein